MGRGADNANVPEASRWKCRRRCMPFQLDIIDEHTAQEIETAPAPLRGNLVSLGKSDEIERLEVLAAAGWCPH
jgi:hypothetical protein